METLSVSQTKLKNEVQQIVSNNKASKVSVYFRDLKNGPWIGVNEEEKFIGGSLLKLPILITYMKLAESDNKILDESLDFKQENVSNRQYFTSSKQLEIGKSYKIKDLLDYMITYSDNNAAYLLMSHISKDDINKTFASLGFGEPQQDQPFPVDTKTYAGFFRVLYNTSSFF
jgi:beta-lactamase class A